MSEPSGASARSRRRLRIEPRLLVGVALVAGSIAGVHFVLAAADRTVEVYQAVGALVPGDRLDGSRLRLVAVSLGAAADGYLAPGGLPEEGAVVTRSIAAGELIPTAALGRGAGNDHAAVILPVQGALPAAVRPGVLVEIWSAPPLDAFGHAPPVQLLPSALVLRLPGAGEQEGLLRGAGQQPALEVLVPRVLLSAVLEAVIGGAAISVVPAGLGIETPIPAGGLPAPPAAPTSASGPAGVGAGDSGAAADSETGVR